MGAVTRLDIEYDGTEFAGWAAQRGLRTVQGEVERALAVLRGGEPTPLTVAGRTDRGVHASGQVASYAGEPVDLRGLNALVPEDVVVTACTPAPDGFDARRWATSRSYEYRLVRRLSVFTRRYTVRTVGDLDEGALGACARALAGEHDFTAFTPAGGDHVRFSRVVSEARWDGLTFSITADAFLRHMNRVLVGTMLEVAGGRRSVESFRSLLDGAPRTAAGPTAPARGLHLTGVTFGDGPTPWIG